MGTISDCWHLKGNLKEKFYLRVYVNSTTQRCSKKILKSFLIKDFFSFASGVNDTSDAPWAANISANFQKNSSILMSGAWGKLIHKKTWSRKSCDTDNLVITKSVLSLSLVSLLHCLLYTVPVFSPVVRIGSHHPLTPPPPHFFQGGTHSLAGEGAGGSQFGRRDRHSGTLVIV